MCAHQLWVLGLLLGGTLVSQQLVTVLEKEGNPPKLRKYGLYKTFSEKNAF